MMDRRKFLVGSGLAAGAALGAGVLQRANAAAERLQTNEHTGTHSRMRAVGELKNEDMDPTAFATDYHWGDRVEDLGDGRKLRVYEIGAVDRDIEIAPGITFPAWTYNGQVPGPTLRANEGDRIRIEFQNSSSHPHTIHFHGIHTPEMDGIPGVGDGVIETGESTVYEFDALPYGCHLYHCHALPLKRHIHKGLYGGFIIDPRFDDEGRPATQGGAENIQALVKRMDRGEPLPGQVGGEAPGTTGYDRVLGVADHEYIMVMNGFDTNFDGDNEIYAVNSKAFCYAQDPLEIDQDALVRVFLVNVTEFDAVNSFHLHALFFDYYDTGRLENRFTTVDTISQIQAQRGILQFRAPYPGPLMFHAHQSEFAELGWMGFFDVQGTGQAGTGSPSQPGRTPLDETPTPEPLGGGPGESATGPSTPAAPVGTPEATTPASRPAVSKEEIQRAAKEATERLVDRAKTEVLR